MAKKANFKEKNTKFFIRDKIRLESIFSNIECKNKEMNNNLLKNNKNILRNNSKNGKINNFSFSYKNRISDNFLNLLTLKNNLKFNNINKQNETLLKKKHRMDINLQKALDLNHQKKDAFSMMSTNLNLMNNQIQLKIKKKTD